LIKTEGGAYTGPSLLPICSTKQQTNLVAFGEVPTNAALVNTNNDSFWALNNAFLDESNNNAFLGDYTFFD